MLNIVMPVLNEEKGLKRGIETIIHYLDTTNLCDKYHITIVDNGSSDNTLQIAKTLSTQYRQVRYIETMQRGVGIAFRMAIEQNDDEFIGYMDIDLATDITHLVEVYHIFSENHAKIVVGSRLLPSAKVHGRSLKREISSRMLNVLLHIILKTKFTDAMCGFKFYQKDVARKLVINGSDNHGWFYCAEMLIRAEWMNIPIIELPVKWQDDCESKVKIIQLSWIYLKEIGKLYKEKNRNLGS